MIKMLTECFVFIFKVLFCDYVIFSSWHLLEAEDLGPLRVV